MRGTGRWRAAAAAFLVIPATVFCLWAAPSPTPYSMDLYGRVEGAMPGDVVRVYDPQGTLCGSFTVTKEGNYGFLHVYGDDRATAADEGALAGDPLTFRLNDEARIPVAAEAVLWRVDDRVRVDLRR